MNFMPSEDAFFDEPLHDAPVSYGQPPAPQVAEESRELLESSLRQEKLLERLLGEMEKMNRRLFAIETSGALGAPREAPKPVASPTGSATPKPSRGTFVLPPGSRPAVIPNIVEPKPAEDREKAEEDAIFRRRAEEEARIARIEAERREREAEEERKRIAEIKRLEDERRMKEELEKKTRGLMSGLLTSSGGGLFADENIDAPAPKKGGLFDD